MKKHRVAFIFFAITGQSTTTEMNIVLKKIQSGSLYLKRKKFLPASLIAFRLAQLPEEQEYAPNGDWNQGMLSVNVPPGSTLDITVRWDIKGKPYELTLKEVYCAKQTTL